MPTYCYRRVDTGRVVEVVMTIAEKAAREKRGGIILEDGVLARRDLAAEHGRFRDTPSAWPMASDAASVHPDQIPEAVAAARAAGVPTEFNADGCPIFESRLHRKRFCEAHGLFDRNGGYGDPQRRN